MISTIILQGGGFDFNMIMLPLALAVLYFFMIRPQMNRQKKEKAFQAEIKKGSKVITSSGIHGKIVETNSTDNTITLETGAGLGQMSETDGGFPEISSTRSDKVLLFDATPVFNSVIAFEGTAEDAFETSLVTINPTADRTINIPNESGTIITTGSVGAITGTMIAAGTLNATMISNDSITLDKMADDSVGQAQLKDVVDLQIQNSSGGILKQIFGAGS